MYWSLIVLLFIIDILSKEIAEKKIRYNPKKILKGKIELIYIRNYGIAFNKFNYKRKFILASNFVLLIYLAYLMTTTEYPLLPLSLIMAGGLGNSINRLAKGYVIDFIYFNIKKFPVFNIADFYIFIGAGIIIYQDLIGRYFF